MTEPRYLPVRTGRVPIPGSARAWLAERSQGTRLHAGVDLADAGVRVTAPESGEVVLVGNGSYADELPRRSQPRGFAGYGPSFVVLKGDSGYWHLLAHVEHVDVAVGQRVRGAAPIASVSAQSRHVHWEVRRRLRPPAGAATVEICDDPVSWLMFVARPWTKNDGGCPINPVGNAHTPRACRPGAPPELADEIIAPDIVPSAGPPPDPTNARAALDVGAGERTRGWSWRSRLLSWWHRAVAEGRNRWLSL